MSKYIYNTQQVVAFQAGGFLTLSNDTGSIMVLPTQWVLMHSDGSIEVCDDARFRAEYKFVKE